MAESKYLKMMPSLYRSEGVGVELDFTNRFLHAFQRALSGVEGEIDPPRGLEEVLDRFADYFDPDLAPPQILPYLAQWVALDFVEDEEWNRNLDDLVSPTSGDMGLVHSRPDQLYPLETPLRTRNRELIKSISDLYRIRGTFEGIKEYIRIYTGQSNVEIREYHTFMKVGTGCKVGHTTLAGNRPYYFQVVVSLSPPEQGAVEQYEKAILDIIEKEKPAHTYFHLILKVDGLAINVHSTVGTDTLLGGEIVAGHRANG